MPSKNETYKLCKIYDAGGDLSKRWFVYFYLLDPVTRKFKRRKEYAPSNLSAPERHAHLQALKDTLDKLLIGGKIGKPEALIKRAEPRQLIPCLQSVLDLKITVVSQRTRNTYESVFRMIVAWLEMKGLENIYPKDFSRGMASEMIRHYHVQRGWIAKTFNVYLGLMSTLFEQMIENEDIEKNPFSKIRRLPEREPNVRIWTDEEQAIISEYMKLNDPQLYLIANIVYKASLRPKEIAQLKFSDIKHDTGVIIAPSGITKNRKSKPVTMSERLSEMIIHHQNEAPKNFYLFDSNLLPGPTHCHRNRISERFKKAREACGLHSDLKLYSFKHKGNLDDILNHNVTLLQIKERNRHHSLTETDRYTRRLLKQADPQLRKLNNEL